MRIPIAERARVSRQCVVSLELVDPKVNVNMIDRKGNWLIFQYFSSTYGDVKPNR